MSAVEDQLARIEAASRGAMKRLRRIATLSLVAVFYVTAWRLAGVDLPRLWHGLPKLADWAVRAWPPDLSELPFFASRAAETIAMAALGTTAATVLALPAAVLVSRNVTPVPFLVLPLRWVLNALRSIDAFIFAILFVAAVGLGPFAGVLGIALHTCGSAARLFSDSIENADLSAYNAVRSTGAGRIAAIGYALMPDLSPVILSTALFWWEFNVRASTVLGVIGAGGIGQEVKNSLDLLDFPRLATILAVILVTVTGIDALSARMRRVLTRA